ncbi:oxidoreductase [Gammaproteobacteria bacterium 54_18_T64]|mgnify:CR=1 FL=1|nr:oxidoreductase [Gammaproteobacteria bacterium 54_18_T64]
MKQKIAFLGLGVMGYPMAGHLSRKGFEVTVYNRTAARAEDWITEFSGQMALTPAAAASGADIVFACVGQDDDVRAITIGDQGAFDTLSKGAVFVDHTTASAALARELDEECQQRGCHFIDAPVSGGQQGAENGRLTVMCGGEESAFTTVTPVIESYAQTVKLLGPSGSGQLCKMVNQVCIAGLVQGLAEGLHFAQASGLDADAVIEVISKGAAQSWQMENRYQTMLANEFAHGFAVDWMRKDLDMVLQEARRNGAQLPVTALVDQFYADVQAAGGGRWDTSSLLTRLKSQVKPDEN